MAFGRSAATLPILAICCLALILFAIAATIVLALIPVYLTRKDAPNNINSHRRIVTYSVDVPDTIPTGALSDSERAQITALLKSSQTDKTLSNGDLSTTSADVVDAGTTLGRRKRRQEGIVLILIILITGRSNVALNNIEDPLSLYISEHQADIIALLEQITSSRTTTVPSNLLSSTTTIPSGIVSTTTASPGRRRRRAAYKWPPLSQSSVLYKD